MTEFDVSDLTDKVSRLEIELAQADRLNGKLMRMIENVLAAWHELEENPETEAMDAAMAELEEAFDEASAIRRDRDAESSS